MPRCAFAEVLQKVSGIPEQADGWQSNLFQLPFQRQERLGNTIPAKDKDKDKDKEKDKSSSKSLTRFVPPTPADVEAYCAEKGYRLDAGYFVDYYAARGWKIKGQPMKDWRAAVRTWIHRDGQTSSPLTPSTATADETRRMQAMLRHLQEA